MKSGTFLIWAGGAWVAAQAIRCWVIAIRELVSEYKTQRLYYHLYRLNKKSKPDEGGKLALLIAFLLVGYWVILANGW